MRQAWNVSIRKACDALRVDRSLYHYKGKRGEQADLKLRIKQICETLRYGYRRVHVLLRREGWDVNPKRIYRLYKEMGLQLGTAAAEQGAEAPGQGQAPRRPDDGDDDQ